MSTKIIDDLLNQGIITEEENAQLNSELKDKSQDILRVLFRFFYKQSSGESYPSGPVMFIYRITEIQKDKVEPELLNGLLDILFSNKLLENITYAKLKDEISNFQIVNSLHLVYRLGNLDHFYKNFTQNHQLEFAKQLAGEDFKSSLVEDRKKKKLAQAIEKGELTSYLDFFKYCYNCIFFEFKPEKYNRNDLFKRSLKVFAELSYDGFVIDNCSYKIIENERLESSSNKLIDLSFQIAGKNLHYTYELREDLINKKANHSYDIEHFLVLLNNTLADFNFQYRFILIKNTSESKIPIQEDNQFAICRVDQHMQSFFDFSKLHEKFLFARPHIHFWPSLSYYQIQYAIYHYQVSGVLNHLTAQEIDNTSNAVFDNAYGNYANLLSSFPNTVSVIKRWERIEKQPYRFFLELLNKISHNILTFYDIEDGYPSKGPIEKEIEFVVSFKINNEAHSLTLTAYTDFNTQIVHYVNEIVKKNYPDYMLHDLISMDVGNNYYMFSTIEQGKYLNKYKILQSRPIF
ncbi:MAG TPA: hypothetical protein VK668_00190 [Mucilaginibacter sp.]|nr:hypothetical protein [Mucilaginibacter sp.]